MLELIDAVEAVDITVVRVRSSIREDARQDVFLAVVLAMSRFDPSLGVPLRAYLLMRARYALIDFYRRLKPLVPIERDMARKLAGREPSPEHQAMSSQNSVRLRSQLAAQLNPRELRVIVANYWEQKTGIEVAHEMGYSLANIRMLRRTALAKLRLAGPQRLGLAPRVFGRPSAPLSHTRDF